MVQNEGNDAAHEHVHVGENEEVHEAKRQAHAEILHLHEGEKVVYNEEILEENDSFQ